MKTLIYFLIGINLIGFIISAIKAGFYKYIETKKIDITLLILSLLGGSIGILFAILIIDKKPQKENMMVRVSIFCIFIMQILLLLIFKGTNTGKIDIRFWNFLINHNGFTIYLLTVNILTFITFGIDKLLAIKEKRRIKILTLLGLSFAGGSIGGLSAMYMFRHKTSQNYFTIGIPLIMVVQLMILIYLNNIY